MFSVNIMYYLCWLIATKLSCTGNLVWFYFTTYVALLSLSQHSVCSVIKVKITHARYERGVRDWSRSPGSQPTDDIVKPGGRLPLRSTRSAVTFPATEHHRPLTGTKLYCLVTEARVCVNNLPKVTTWQCIGPESILGPFSHQSGLLLLHHKATLRYNLSSLNNPNPVTQCCNCSTYGVVDIEQKLCLGRASHRLVDDLSQYLVIV